MNNTPIEVLIIDNIDDFNMYIYAISFLLNPNARNIPICGIFCITDRLIMLINVNPAIIIIENPISEYRNFSIFMAEINVE